MLLLLPVVAAGSLLPTWIFVNSLQLVAHTVLISSLMPGNASFFLSKFLNWVRWHNEDFIQWL